MNHSFPGGSEGKESACKVGDPASILGLGRPPVEGHGNPLQYSGLENPMDRGTWWATVHGVTKNQTQLSNYTFTFIFNKHSSQVGLSDYFLLRTHIPYNCLSLSNGTNVGLYYTTLTHY